jgi:hypothetical protein
MMIDPLDEVIDAFQKETEAKRLHQAILSQVAGALVNGWRFATNPIITEMNTKLKAFGIRIGEAEGVFSSDGSPSGASLTISARRGNDFHTGKAFPKLVMTLIEVGDVKATLSVSRDNSDFEARVVGSGGDFPESDVRRVLADYAAYCLRH